MVEEEEDTGALKTDYQDIIISDVRTHNGVNFSVQILNTEGLQYLLQDIVDTHERLRYQASTAAHARVLLAPQDRCSSAKFHSKVQ